MDNVKLFCFNNSSLFGQPHDKFQKVFDLSHHFVTGKYHNGRAGVDFLDSLTTGQLTNLVTSNNYISGSFHHGDYMFGLRDKNYRIWVAVEDEKHTTYYNTNYPS